jgi:RND family efflux transporter MFP subunit
MDNPDTSQTKRRSGKATSILIWGITGLMVVIIMAVVVYAYNRQVADPIALPKKHANVEVITVRPREYRETLTLPALLEADRTAVISPEFAGTLERWDVSEGMEIKQGQIVARLDTDAIDTSIRELEASLLTSQKNIRLVSIAKEASEVELANARKQVRLQELSIDAARSELELAKVEFGRVNGLVGKKVMNVASLDTARNMLKQKELEEAKARETMESKRLEERSAELRIKKARADLDLATARIGELNAAIDSLKVRRDKTILKSPISGKIEEHLLEPGEVVMAGTPLAYVYDLRYMRATVNVPDRYVSFLDPSNPASQAFIQMNMPGARQQIRTQLVVPGLPKLTGGTGRGITLDARVDRIAQASDPASNTFKVVLRLPNPSGVLRHGIIAQGRIEYLYYPRAIVIPVKAVQVTNEGPRVLVVETSEGVQLVRVREIDPISVRGNLLLIGKGLTEGDRLIIAGWKGLVAGEQVNVLVEDGRFITGQAKRSSTAALSATP